MTTYMYTMSVPVFKQLLNSLSAILTKAEVLTTEKKFEPTVLLDARLFPDMFPLIRQVQIATDFLPRAFQHGWQVSMYQRMTTTNRALPSCWDVLARHCRLSKA